MVPRNGRRKGFMGKVTHFWRTSYVPDWLGLLLVLIGYLVSLMPDPYHRMFSLDDQRIQYPHAEVEGVPLLMLFIYAMFLPLGVITIYIMAKPQSDKSSKMHQIHVTILGLLISLACTSCFTDVVKNGVGRPRPDLIARCKPKDDTPKHELVTWEVCTETDHHTLHDGWRSFPSGHSSFAFAGLLYLGLFLWGQLQAFRRGADLGKFLIGFLPSMGAIAIAISRTEDYRHDVYDVTIGSIIGALIAYYSYRRYYPSINSPISYEPFATRLEEDEKASKGFEVLDSPDLEMQDFDEHNH